MKIPKFVVGVLPLCRTQGRRVPLSRPSTKPVVLGTTYVRRDKSYVCMGVCEIVSECRPTYRLFTVERSGHGKKDIRLCNKGNRKPGTRFIRKDWFISQI